MSHSLYFVLLACKSQPVQRCGNCSVGTKADVPRTIRSRKGLALPFNLVPYPLDVPSGLVFCVYSKHRAEIVSVFQ